jgi:hypothetical protein
MQVVCDAPADRFIMTGFVAPPSTIFPLIIDVACLRTLRNATTHCAHYTVLARIAALITAITGYAFLRSAAPIIRRLGG